MRTHLVIPDTQAKAGVPTDHLGWIGQYIVDQFWGDDLAIIHLGDHWDMPSLSAYDKGKRRMENQRYTKDVQAGNEAFALLNEPLESKNARHRETGHHERQWWPERHLLRGNHENRIVRATENDAQMEGALSLDDLESPGWEVHDFLQIVDLDGIWYSHYFYNPMTGHPFSGTVDNRLRQVGHSFTMGHQQTLLYGLRYVGNRSQHGLIAGSCYLHDEDYKGPQGNHHWRGVIVCFEVRDGSYCPMFVSLDYLCRRYEGQTLERFTQGALT